MAHVPFFYGSRTTMKPQKVSSSAFQTYLADRFQSQDWDQLKSQDRRLGVLLGDLFFLVPLTDIEEILPIGMITAVPLTKPWFMGLRSVNGHLIGVIDYVHYALGIQQRLSSESHILIPAIQALNRCGFLVSAVIGVCDVSVMKKGSLMDDGQLRTIYTDKQQRQWREVNWPLLMNMPAFFQVAS